MVTLKDIAQEAGVSIMTVSNVVNGNLSKVSKEKAQNIQEIINRMGYIPNASARSLSKSKTNLIAIVLRGSNNSNSLVNPHNSAVVGTIIQKIQKNGYYAMVNMMNSKEDIIQSLHTWNVDGAIFLGIFDDEIEDMYAMCDIPMIFIDSYTNIRQLSNIGIDDYKGGKLAAQYLISKGHKNMAFISPPIRNNGVVQHRYAGFCDMLKYHGLSLLPENTFSLESDVQVDNIILLGRRLSEERQRFSAIFVTGDLLASYLMQGLRIEGVQIPKDISIIGFDDLPICRQLTPTLTTIAQNLEEKAAFSVDILCRRLQSPASPAESLVLDVALIERNSVAAL